jgi:iron complex outermembrane recepter protein
MKIRAGACRSLSIKPSEDDSRLRSLRWLLAALASLGGAQIAAIPQAAAATRDAPSTDVLSEVIVTATRQSENVQNVPMSITPITAETLQKAGITDFQDYAHMVPNLTFSHSFGVEGADVAIRGIQGTGTVAFYVDDLAIDQALDPRLLDDVQRIEVLEGPQGTLFGARSMGGAVRIITQVPNTHTWGGAINAQGTDFSGGRPGSQTDGYLNIPLIADKLALQISAFDGSSGPFIRRYWLKNPTPATLAGLSNSNLAPSDLSQYPLDSTLTARDNYHGVTASLLWQARDDLSIRTTFMKQVSNDNGWPLSDFEVTPTTSDYTADSLRQIRTFDVPEWESLGWWLAGLTIKYETAIGELTSATGYVHEVDNSLEDVTEYEHNIILPGSSPLAGSISTWSYTHSFSEELRFASKPLGPVQFVAGVYVLRSSNDNGQYANTPGINAESGGVLGSDLAYYASGLSQDFENAIYGDLTYHLTHKLSATIGLRESNVNSAAFLGWSGFSVYPTTGGGGKDVQNVQTPKISVQYQQSPNVMYYALASKGFRPGGGQPAPPIDFCAADYAATGLTPAELSKIGPDYLWNYEIGAKTETFDHRLQANLSAYQINWKNIQQGSRFSCGFTFNVNAGAARSRGAELSLAAAPLSGLQLSASVGYERAVITQSSPTLAEIVGEPVQQIAPWTAAVAADYSFPVTSLWSGILRLDYNYTDHSFSANNNAKNLRLRPSYALVNVRTGIMSDTWEIDAFVDNVTDAHPNLGDSASEAGEDPGRPRIYTIAPRTYGFKVGYRF